MKKKIEVAFKCHSCNNIKKELITPLYDWAEYTGYENIEWTNPNESLPALNQKEWERSYIKPIAGSRRIVRVTYPFYAREGIPFWILHQPDLSYFNGWDEYPEEIEKSSFAKCELIRVIHKDDYHGFIEINIIEAINIEDIGSLIKFKSAEIPLYIFNSQRITSVKHKNWIYIDGNNEGDCGYWMLVRENGENLNMYLYGEWGFDFEAVSAANVLLSEDQKKIVNNMITKHST